MRKIKVKDLLTKVQAYAEAMDKAGDLEEELEDAKENRTDRITRSEATIKPELEEAKSTAKRLGEEYL